MLRGESKQFTSEMFQILFLEMSKCPIMKKLNAGHLTSRQRKTKKKHFAYKQRNRRNIRLNPRKIQQKRHRSEKQDYEQSFTHV